MFMNKNLILRALNIATIFLLMFTVQNSYAASSVMTRYVAIDSVGKTSYVFDENFKQLLDNPLIPKTSIEALPTDRALWYTGSKIDVIRRNANGSIDILSDNPAYSEMVHHIVWGYKTPNRVRNYKCKVARPLASGSELTDVVFPKGYAYKLDAGVLMPVAWHWSNPASVPVSEKIYVRFNIDVDDNPTAYKDVNIDWIDTVACKSTFSTPPGESKKVGELHSVTTDRRIVGIIPHIHDHSKKFKLKSSHGTIKIFKAEHQNIPVAHDDMGQGPTLWHANKHHLPVNGLSAWLPGKFGPVISAGESLWMESKFENPHPGDIDNMSIAVIMWVPVIKTTVK